MKICYTIVATCAVKCCGENEPSHEEIEEVLKNSKKVVTADVVKHYAVVEKRFYHD